MKTKIPGIRANLDKQAHSILAGHSYSIVDEKNKAGRLRLVIVTLEDNAAQFLHIRIDGQDLFNHSYNDLIGAADGSLGLTATISKNGPIVIVGSGTGYVAIQFNVNENPIEFASELLIEVKNTHASTAYKTRASYSLYEID